MKQRVSSTSLDNVRIWKKLLPWRQLIVENGTIVRFSTRIGAAMTYTFFLPCVRRGDFRLV
jgi:hypothetical protein